MSRRKSSSLLALSTTVLALPGISNIAVADSPPVETTTSLKYTNYSEDDNSRRETPFGERQRYDIDVTQFYLLAPVSDNTSIQIDANHEVMSGASPWFTTADIDGNPIANLSGASGIRDTRSELSISGKYYMESGSIAGTVGYSEEDDYRSTYFGISAEQSFYNNHTTVAAGFTVSNDDLFPTDAAEFGRIEKDSKRSVSLFTSISQVINQTTVVQSALSITRLNGYLSDPYKLRDVRPDEKLQIAWSNSLRIFLISADAAIHVDYRFYDDDYGVNSHTLNLEWHQNVNRIFQIIPGIRYYSQSEADFFTNIDNFAMDPLQDQSSDYRLSAYGAISGTLRLVADMGKWSFNLSAERYITDEKYSSFDVAQPSTSLVRYTRVSLGIDFSF